MQEMHDILLINKGLGDINPLVCGDEMCAPGHSFGPASRQYFLLHYVFSGCGRFIRNGKSVPVSKGQIFVISPHEITLYQADKATPWHYAWVGFESSLNLSVILGDDVLTVPECEHIFSAIARCDYLEYSRELYVCGKIYELLSLLGESKSIGESGTSRYVLKAKNYIESNYVNNIDVKRIADYLGLDRSYFSTIFKKHIGCSPQQYILHFRLEKAAELIALYGYSPSEAALSAGYTDIYNFSRMFKRKFGVSPRNYKKLQSLPAETAVVITDKTEALK